MREEYNRVLSTPIQADTNVSVKPKYRSISKNYLRRIYPNKCLFCLVDLIFLRSATNETNWLQACSCVSMLNLIE